MIAPTELAAAPTAPFATIAEALDELRAGRMVVVVDDADRENEGDLTLAAEDATPEAINFMARHGRGLICVALTADRLAHLRIPLMTADNTSNFGTAFCESVDARAGVSTGISAHDRARSIQALVHPGTQPEDLARPGHIFPLRAQPGGVLTRAGQTEAAVDLARLAGRQPAGVICEIMNEDGSMARVPDLTRFCREHELRMVTVAELIRYRLAHERCIHRRGETISGRSRIIVFGSDLDAELHSAAVTGAISRDQPVLVRVQTHCLLGVHGSTACACACNLASARRQIESAGAGVIVYLHQNSAGYEVRDGKLAHPSGAANEPGAQRQIGIGAQILLDLGVRKIRLLTDHPRPLAALDGYGLEIVATVSLQS